MIEQRRATRSGPHHANGLLIWGLRRKKKLTQEALAEASGISRIQMIKLENGMHLPRPDTRDRMAEALGVKASRIKCEEAAPNGGNFRGGSRRDDRGTAPAQSNGAGEVAA